MGLLSFIFKDNILGNIIFILAMLGVSELIVFSIKIYQRTHTINPDRYAKEIEKNYSLTLGSHFLLYKIIFTYLTTS